MAPGENYNKVEDREACCPLRSGMTASEFFTTLWGDPLPEIGMANIFVLPKRESSWYKEFSNIDRDIENHLHEEVYTGVALVARDGARFTKNTRVRAVDAVAIPGIWADIDVAHKVHKKRDQLPPTAEEALALMAQLPYEPTLIVDSGHGRQFWWLFNQPWVFAGKEEWGQACRVTQWWHRMTNELFEARGWVIDSVFDLSRVMRVPGTLNNKVPEKRKQVRVIKDDGPRYKLDDFLKLVPDDFVASSPVDEKAETGGPRNGKKGSDSGGDTAEHTGFVLRADAQPNHVRLEAFLKASPQFRLTWERNRSDLADQSASGYNMSIATRCVRAGWPDQEVVNALICWRALHKEDLKLRDSYYARTLTKAQLFIKENHSDRPTVDSASSTSPGEERSGESVSYTKQRQVVHLTGDEGSNIEACVRAAKLSNGPPTLFAISDRRAIGVLASTEGRIGLELSAAQQTHLEMARRVKFFRETKNGSKPGTPSVTLMSLVHRALRPELPQFNGFKRLPFLWDGSLVTSGGYHAESGYYVDVPADLDLTLSVPAALQIIEEYFAEFPFQGPADKANAFSVVLGLPLKPLGNAPGLFVDKPASQTGASLLCRCLGTIIEGKEPSVVTQGDSIGEFDKRAVSELKNQPAVIIFDNLNRKLDSDMAASGMTDDFFGGRLLGGNEVVRVPTRSITLMFTANNLVATRELQNRCLRCRLDANHPSPETRTNFRYALPYAMLANRVAIVSAVSSITQRWIEAGSPQGTPVLGSFIPYTQAVSGLMAFSGLPHLDGNRRQMVNEVTPSWDNLDTLVLRWWEKHGITPVPAIDLMELAEELDLKGETDRSRATSLSRRLGHALGQVFEVDDGVLVKLLESGRDEKGRAKQGLRYKLMQS